jgi:hypothetical protein
MFLFLVTNFNDVTAILIFLFILANFSANFPFLLANLTANVYFLLANLNVNVPFLLANFSANISFLLANFIANISFLHTVTSHPEYLFRGKNTLPLTPIFFICTVCTPTVHVYRTLRDSANLLKKITKYNKAL